ncbi:MAG TPA: MBL fold metallo-hydrolase [Bacteriovoracaceae bacterium]|nr:MBL fold metallo-hydrolase [Bacteriovoracaceae bacterium]
MKKYFALHPAVFKLDGGAMFGIIPKPLWCKAIPADDQNRILLSLRVMLIKTEKRNILIDTGIGDYHGSKFDERFGIQGEKNPLIDLLIKKCQIRPDDITDLIVTHLHFDHVGGLGQTDTEHVSIFPNATLHVHKQHYAYALSPTLRDIGSFHGQYFKPLIEKAQSQNKIHWLDGDQGEILSDGQDTINFKCSHGHTPFLVHPYDDKFIYMADLVPTSHHVPVAWVMGYDIAPGRTTIDKDSFYKFIQKENLTMIFEHDLKVWGGKVAVGPKGDFQLGDAFAVTSSDPLISELSFD